ncbi:type II toxin-antitoxin system VapC family toxin [Glycomyces albus]
MGVIIDTNVVSELMRSKPEPTVLTWIDALPSDEVWLTAITVQELFFGALRLGDEDRRKATLLSRIDIMVNEVFRGRCAPLDADAGERAGTLQAELERRGRVIDLEDMQIAAICLSREDTLATRNTKHFENLGIVLANPWSD